LSFQFKILQWRPFTHPPPPGGVAVPTVVRKTFVTNVIKWQYLRGVLDLNALRNMTVGTAYTIERTEVNIIDFNLIFPIPFFSSLFHSDR
jgi:hypothetical protein